MPNHQDDLMSIIVLEAGAAWPAWISEYQRIAPNAVIIAQAQAEPADSFRTRVVHRVAEALAAGTARVRVGVIVSSALADPPSLLLRETVARAILAAMGTNAEADLVIAGDGQGGDPTRHDLFALVGVLCEELGGTKINVRVRFTSSKSGVMRAVAPAGPDEAAEPRLAKRRGG